MSKTDVVKGWEDDKLNRVSSAVFLTEYLTNLYAESSDDIYLDSFVLNINAGWGFGKTFFLKHWMADLKEAGHPVIYFDAWINDYSENALLAFMAEFEDSIGVYKSKVPKGKELVDDVLKSARKVIAPTLAIVGNAITRKFLGESIAGIKDSFTGEKDVSENKLADGVGNFISEYVNNSLKDHRETKNAIESFKKSLGSLVKALNEQQNIKLPFFILIDELDRCRPTYSIELLEGIKHLFGVNGVFFVIATNKSQLVHSIKAIYGSEFDSSTYLRRFFDQEYVLPEPDRESFANYLVDAYRLNSTSKFIVPLDTALYPGINLVAKTFAVLTEGFKLSLRDQVQVIRQLKAISLTTNIDNIHLIFLLFLIIYRQQNEVNYTKFVTTSLDLELRTTVAADFDKNATINAWKATPHNGRRRSSLNVLEIIFMYKDNMDINAISLHSRPYDESTLNGFLSKLSEEAPSSYNQGEHYPLSISRYPELIHQAGHLQL